MTHQPKSIFILGAGVMQLPAIRAAKAMGWRVTVADGNAEAEGIPLADRFAHVDLKDLDAMTQAVKLCQVDGGVDGVFTAGTDFSAAVAWVAGRCGLPGLAYETALNATDKVRMRRAFREHGVPQPEFVELNREGHAAGVLQSLSFPLVVKPVDNMGARGVRRAETADPPQQVSGDLESGRQDEQEEESFPQRLVGRHPEEHGQAVGGQRSEEHGELDARHAGRVLDGHVRPAGA